MVIISFVVPNFLVSCSPIFQPFLLVAETFEFYKEVIANAYKI
jgi:hypothetical protein